MSIIIEGSRFDAEILTGEENDVGLAEIPYSGATQFSRSRFEVKNSNAAKNNSSAKNGEFNFCGICLFVFFFLLFV